MLDEAKIRKPDAERDAAQAERSMRLAEAACHESVEALRAALAPDAPCPVCGSTSHPYQGGDSRLRAVLDGLRAEAGRCRQVLAGLAQQEAAQASFMASGQRQLAEVEEEMRSLAVELARDRQRWEQHPIAVDEAGAAEEFRGEWFARQLQGIREELETLGRQELAGRESLRRQEAARQALDKASRTQAKAAEEAAGAVLAYQQASQAAQAASARAADLEGRLDGLLNQLDAPFPDPDWRESWRADPQAFQGARAAAAEAWSIQAKARLDLETRSAAIASQLKALAQGCSSAAENLKRQQESFSVADASLREKEQQRLALFEGKPVAQVEGALARAIEDQKRFQAEAQQAAQKAATDESRAQEARRQARAQQDRRQADRARVQSGLSAWLDEFNARSGGQLDAAGLRGLLSHDAAWMGSERAALQALDTAVETAQAILRERQAARESRERARPTPEAADALREALAGAAGELEAARARVTAVDIELGKDDERRARSTELVQAIERQEARARVWAQLSDLIGSADGKKFRNFAQQLTLDVLLGYANRHLEKLARRYRLERIRDSLALLVVDQDMGGEMRSVHSLSGGESFLLSLALALGLASLSSHQVRVESLFIDEGFGSLDAESLRVAMEALDSLQAQGRKVGVISHVQEMTERIGTQIQVRRLAGGQSRLTTASP